MFRSVGMSLNGELGFRLECWFSSLGCFEKIRFKNDSNFPSFFKIDNYTSSEKNDLTITKETLSK